MEVKVVTVDLTLLSKLEVLSDVNAKTSVFWSIMIPCSLVEGYLRFGGT